MINGIAGKPGGGKSYEAVKNHVIPALKEGRRVVTNLPLQIEHFVAVYGEQVRNLIVLVTYDYHDYGNQKPFSRIEDWLEHQDWKNEKGQGVLFVIDEAHLSLPSRMQKGSGLDITKVLEFLSMHRHYGFDVLLITQNFKKIHADIRDMVQLVYRCIKKSMFGQDDEYIIKVHEGCTSQVVNTDERAYESYVFKFYKSHTKSESQIVEATTRDVTPWHKTGLMKVSYVILFFALLMIVNVARIIMEDDESIDSNDVPIEKKVSVNSESVVSPEIQKNQLNKSKKTDTEIQKKQNHNIRSIDETRISEYQEMINRSNDYHPYYKVNLSVSGYSVYTSNGFQVKVIYFSASQNGQHIFTLNNTDLIMSGYDVQVLGDCAVAISFFNYSDYLTCNAPVQSGSSVGEQLASNN